MTYTRTRCPLPKLNVSHSVVIITILFKIPPINYKHLDSGSLIQNQDQHHNYSAWTKKRSANLEQNFSNTDTNFVMLMTVVVVVVISQTCNLRLTKVAMMSFYIRKISNTKSLNQRMYILLGILFLEFCVMKYVVFETMQLHVSKPTSYFIFLSLISVH
jgi:hypothetical protein